MAELETLLAAIAVGSTPRSGDPFGQGRQLHRRRRHQRISGNTAPRRTPATCRGAASRSCPGSSPCACPSVAVLNGNALGGGLELALAATWRIGLPAEQPCLGFPEVQLGLHPGFGGTVRAVSLLGVRRGMELMLTGRSMTMTDAAALRLDRRISSPESWRRDAVELLSRPRPQRRPHLVDTLIVAARSARLRRSFTVQAGTAQGAPGALPGPVRHD